MGYCVTVSAVGNALSGGGTTISIEERIMIDRHHAIMFCPNLYCKCQRTWTSYDTVIYICDHCKLKMKYREVDGRMTFA